MLVIICAKYGKNLSRIVQDVERTIPGLVFYLLFWSPSHIKFLLQVTWSFFVFTPRDLEAKPLGKIPSDCGCWLRDILGCSYMLTCILYLFKFIYVTSYGIFYNVCTKAVRILCSDKSCIRCHRLQHLLFTSPLVAMVLHSVTSL